MLSGAEPGWHRTFLERICDGIAEEFPDGLTVKTDGGRQTLLALEFVAKGAS